MERSRILERLYELNSEGSSDKNCIMKLLYDITHNNISLSDAEIILRKVDPTYVRYEFLQNLKGKPIYKNIAEYKKGNLEDIQIAKMISSLITQILIQHEQNPELNIKSLQIDSLLELIEKYSDSSIIDYKKLDDLLDQYGWSNTDD